MSSPPLVTAVVTVMMAVRGRESRVRRWNAVSDRRSGACISSLLFYGADDDDGNGDDGSDDDDGDDDDDDDDGDGDGENDDDDGDGSGDDGGGARAAAAAPRGAASTRAPPGRRAAPPVPPTLAPLTARRAQSGSTPQPSPSALPAPTPSSLRRHRSDESLTSKQSSGASRRRVWRSASAGAPLFRACTGVAVTLLVMVEVVA